MTTALVIVVVSGALALPLQMLWALARRRSPSRLLLRDRYGASVSARQRRLAWRVAGMAGARAEDRPATSGLRR
jgi:hypothetical protein